MFFSNRVIGRIVTVLLILAVMVSGIGWQASAKEAALVSPYYAKLEESVGERTAELTTTLYAGVLAHKTEINIRSFNVPINAVQAIQNWLEYDCPELFHYYVLGYSYIGTTLFSIRPNYLMTAEEYQAAVLFCEKVSGDLLKGIEGNSALSEAEKALLIHDRLAVWCAYENDTSQLYGGSPVYSMYGLFANRRAVCEGYAEAYNYLLKRVGIFNYVCCHMRNINDPNDDNHAWNIVYIGGKPYHVDVTWDDPTVNNSDLKGYVRHTYFMISESEIQALRSWNDYQDSLLAVPQDSTSDMFWNGMDKQTLLIGDSIYYYDAYEKAIKNARTGEILKGSLSSPYHYQDGYYFASLPFDNYFGIASTGDFILYNQEDGIYALNVKTGSERKLFQQIEDNCIYGNFTCINGAIEYDVYRIHLSGNQISLAKEGEGQKLLFDVTPKAEGEDETVNTLDLLYIKKVLATGQTLFVDGFGKIESAEDLALIRRLLLAQ